MREIISFLVEKRAPLLANVYPFYTLFYNEQPDLTPEFALFTSSSVNRFGYQNLFDALVDSFNYALEKEGGSSLEVVVSESGWPSGGNNISTTEYAQTYYPNLILHVNSGRGTPRRPGKPIETYLFEMFDESEKPGNEWDKYFGLFSPDKRPKYQINGFN
uniref:Glucan endo-1,3-beta-glucosidase-like n=1 Tax=Nelumbo nucifera TaxID=4432 RepID=A0A822Y6D5_NELNU|nr:TPA_asm: hypothetical protein HUJ06_031022 [Nelumbo nucifera]